MDPKDLPTAGVCAPSHTVSNTEALQDAMRAAYNVLLRGTVIDTEDFTSRGVPTRVRVIDLDGVRYVVTMMKGEVISINSEAMMQNAD